MFSASQKIRRRAFFSIWKEGVHPITELSADIKRLLYPQMRGVLLISRDDFFSSDSIPDWVAFGSLEVRLCVEQNIQQTNWHFKNTEVHVFIIHEMLFCIWVDIPTSNDINELIDVLNLQLVNTTLDDKYIPTWQLAIRFGSQKLQDRGTYLVALVVGSLITVYGQFVVPYLRNELGVWDTFVEKMLERPKLSIFSILLAYLFPIGVQLQATIVTRLREYRAKERNSRR